MMEDDLCSGISCQQLTVYNALPCTVLWGWAGGENQAERRRKKEEQKEKEEKKMKRKREHMAASP